MSVYKKIPGKEPIKISNKGNVAEEYVNTLSETAYLKYWCYPNPIDISGNKKEICDLLILFFDTAIIISVKNYDLKGDYERYKRRVIEKSSKQLFGAERKLFNSQKPLDISHPEKGVETFNPIEYKNVFRITVSVGEDFENYEFVDSKEGKGSVNIFNKETFEIITEELDTIKDLVEYLKAREDLLITNSGKKCNCTEKDLLGHFLMNQRTFDENIKKDFEKATLELVGKWNEYINNRSVILKKLADENSYFIDKIVENDVLPIENGVLLAKELMSLSRFERRIMANKLFYIVKKYENQKNTLARLFLKYNHIGFLFVYYPEKKPEKEVDFIMNKAPELYAHKHNTKKIVVLGATDGLKQWKFGLYLASDLNETQKKQLDQIADKAGWFKREIKTKENIKEYPNE
ncbi:MAG: hypothetical protein CL530_04625 [Aequorivita sp.]|nr:hypothetical protein [Aequorivita sp.]|tara:strand:+ start:284 stop:1498 length:1215 start_codon:yes stop_codon:yes gene_type:complete